MSASLQLRRSARTLKTALVLRGAVAWLTLTGLLVLAGCWADNLLALPAGLRCGALLLTGGGALLLLARRVLGPLLQRWRPERVARTLESRCGLADNSLINAYQFETRALAPAEASFTRATRETSLRQLEALPRAALWEPRQLVPWVAGALGILATWALYAGLFPEAVENAWQRYTRPLAEMPPLSPFQLTLTAPAGLVVDEGADVLVQASLKHRAGPLPETARATLVWRPGTDPLPPEPDGGTALGLAPAAAGAPGIFQHRFRAVRTSFTCRAFADATYSPPLTVTVRPLPRLQRSTFHLTPPAYTGLPAHAQPGPPERLRALPGTVVRATLTVDQPLTRLVWQAGERARPCRALATGWDIQFELAQAESYALIATTRHGTEVTVATGALALAADRQPEVDFTVDNRNQFLVPGESLALPLAARDDHGIATLGVQLRDPTGNSPVRTLKRWSYLGPPGRAGPLAETMTFVADPQLVPPGQTVLVEAWCRDFSPGGQAALSRPVVLRIKSPEALSVSEADPLHKAFGLLRRALVQQRSSQALTGNLQANLAEARAGKRLADHARAIAARQRDARKTIAAARSAFTRVPSGRTCATALTPLIEGEIPWVLTALADLPAAAPAKLEAALARLDARQAYIATELLRLLGALARSEPDRRPADTADSAAEPDLMPTRQAAEDLVDDLEDFVRGQKRILERSRSLLEDGPDDLTEAEEVILGELAREESKWARFLEEKISDFSKLAPQDFADGTMAEEFNEVFQEVQLAAKELYDKNVEIAVPHEQAGVEGAEELIHNLERWLPDTPDHEKWLMEEAQTPADIPLADLPGELEDIVGELLDDEEAMAEDVEDVTSSWMDSLDKGAGWDAADGPISNMSARGVTGNRLPNEQEIGGRAGEGRQGRSHGQMAETTAEGKGGRETPTRLTPSPFETGSVEDTATEEGGGATGGGKLSGFTGEGLRGPAPPQLQQQMARLQGAQAALRQRAEAVALVLKKRNLPSGDLETAIAGMRRFEAAAKAGDGLAVRRSYTRVLDAMADAHRQAGRAALAHREENRLPDHLRAEIHAGYRDGVPTGYERLVAEYFRALAETPPPAPEEQAE